MKPIVFIAVGDRSTVVVTPNSSHTENSSWKEVEEEIRCSYVQECIIGFPERCRGIDAVLEFFGKHPEWECTFSEGTPIYSHMLGE